MFEPLREHGSSLRSHVEWPSRDALQALVAARGVVTAGGARLRLVAGTTDEPYEQRIRTAAEMHVREKDWHDFFNTLVWLTYPQTKAALNNAQYAALMHERASARERSPQRGATRDALTLFDENGAIVLSSDVRLLDDVRAFRWKRLFWERRDEVRAGMRFLVFGHALFHKALRPYVGITAHAMLLAVTAEVVAMSLSRQVETADNLGAKVMHTLTSPSALSPLPLLGIPGWWSENEDPAFYDNAAYFRSGRGPRT